MSALKREDTLGWSSQPSVPAISPPHLWNDLTIPSVKVEAEEKAKRVNDPQFKDHLWVKG